MASENLKGRSVRVAADGKKARPQVSATNATSKQKTRLDSFFTRKASKAALIEDQPASVIVDDAANSFAIPNEPETSSSSPALIPKAEVKRPPTPIYVTDDDSPSSLSSSIVELTSVANILQVTQKRPVFIQDQNTLSRSRSPSVVIVDHPIIGVANVPTTSQLSNPKGEGKTSGQPILVDSSPIKDPSTTMKPNKPIHPFFGGAKSKAVSSSMPPIRKIAVKSSEAQAPSFPDRSSQHVKGPQTATPYIPLTTFSTRVCETSQQPAIADEPTNYEFLKRGKSVVDDTARSWVPHILDPSPEAPSLDIPPEHEANHPAIARLIHDIPQGTLLSRRPWTEKWRPSCAAEVLGNEQSATYLRNWLRALELQLEGSAPPPLDPVKGKAKTTQRGLKRARIIRAVEKQRKRSRIDSDEEDDWIVRTDDETDEEIPDQEMNEYGDILSEPAPSSPSSSVDVLPSNLPDSQQLETVPELGQLHNTLLLVGPHGSGKTASVYACAEELGWEVFEVYPGIGRRNGASVDNLIGEVGKNHLVLQNRQPEDIMKSFVQPKKKTGMPEPLVGSDYSPRMKSTSQSTSELEDMDIHEAKPIRQSLILLEEVDILFKDDTNFWTTVTRIIKECKRPVICTCNDISLIPVHELPLQTILQFNSCQPDVAGSYLQVLCSAEGYAIQPEFLRALYMDPMQDQLLSNPFSAGVPQAFPDLRRTINTLQILCGATNSTETVRSGPLSDSTLTMSANINGANAPGELLEQCSPGTRRISAKESEFHSYLDCALQLNSLRNFAESECGGYLASDNDEIGHVILYDQHVRDATQYGLNDRHEDILASTVQLSRGVFDVDVAADNSATETLEENIRKTRSEQRTALQEVCPISVWTRQDASIRLDYMPMIRQIVEAEDAQEEREMEKRPKGGRNTRNSARSGYVRILDLTEQGRRVLVTKGLQVA